MDWVKIVYAVILLVCGILIIGAIFSKKDDERKKFIKMKAQSYAFVVVIGSLLIHVVETIYLTVQGHTFYNVKGYGISPLVSLTLLLITYLITILIYRKKYGD
ncbi:hypothetical protein SFC66_12830 [Terribacillus saccharophilus]|uniref:hypothetical protein n=1 Tax=Terribacillus saccharophilus TaxID=361277 RepID=UPI0039829B44